MPNKPSYVLIDIIDEYHRLTLVNSIKLTHGQICEIFRQMFEAIDGEFKTSVKKMDSLKFELIFSNLQQIPSHCIDELKEVILELTFNIYHKLHTNRLLYNYLPEAGFPFFVEHISTNTVYLRMDNQHTPVPY